MPIRGESIQPTIIEWLQKHKGETITVSSVAVVFPEMKRQSISQCLRTIASNKLVKGFVQIGTGTYRMDDPSHSPTAEMFEWVKSLRNNRALLQDEEGELWVARKLDTTL